MPSKPSRFNKGFTLVELLVVIAIIGILVGMILPAVQAAREQARRTSCLNKVRNVALACVSYESANQQFPAAVSSGEESFLVRILPMIEQGGLYDSFRASTGTDPRISLSMNLIDTFICDSTTQVQSEANSFGGTFTSHYASSAGPVSLGTSGPYTVDNGFAREINGNDNGLIGLRGLFSPTNSSNVFAAATKSGVSGPQTLPMECPTRSQLLKLLEVHLIVGIALLALGDLAGHMEPNPRVATGSIGLAVLLVRSTLSMLGRGVTRQPNLITNYVSQVITPVVPMLPMATVRLTSLVKTPIWSFYKRLLGSTKAMWLIKI